MSKGRDCPRCAIRGVIWLRDCDVADCPIVATQANLDGTAYDGRRGPLWCAAISAVILAIATISAFL